MTEQHPGQPWGAPQQQWPPPNPASAYPAVPAPPPALPDFPHPEPRPYHLMLRTWNYDWWKPVVGVLMFLALFLVVQVLAGVGLVVTAAVGNGSFTDNVQRLTNLDKITPGMLLVINLSLGALVLVSWLTIRVVHRMRPRWLASVKPKMRWRFFFACLGLAVVALVAQVLVGRLIPSLGEGDVGGNVNHFTATSAQFLLVVVLTTPLQAAGEEYGFRGYLMQAIGSFWAFSWAPAWLARWVAIVATATVFAFAHGGQNFPLFFDRFMFGLIAGWLVTYTGGLEAGIALHVLNNFLAFGVALTFGSMGQTLTVSEVSWWNIVLTVTQSGIYTALVVLVTRKMRLRTMTQPPSSPAAVGAATPAPSGP